MLVQFPTFLTRKFIHQIRSQAAAEMSPHGPSALESALVGCLCGLFATFCVYPLDLVKNRLSVHVRSKVKGDKPMTSLEIVRMIVADRGISGLYEGIGGRALQCCTEDFIFFWYDLPFCAL